jgi:hypothetical protein
LAPNVLDPTEDVLAPVHNCFDRPHPTPSKNNHTLQGGRNEN